jgi:hypothetical protein
MFPHGDTWGGGGIFLDSDTYAGLGWDEQPVDSHAEFVRAFPARTISGKPSALKPSDHPGAFGPVDDARLARLGWTEIKDNADRKKCDPRFERPVGHDWILHKCSRLDWLEPDVGRGQGFESHHLRHAVSGAVVELPEWEWADLDGQRLVFARRGCLMSGRLAVDGTIQEKLIADLNDMRFEPRRAPYD